MASIMGCKTTVMWFILLGVIEVTRAINIDISGDWKSEVGWEVVCSWTIPPGDKLQSVRLYNNDQQFLIFRPETHGVSRTASFRIPDYELNVLCRETVELGLKGKCVLTVQPEFVPENNLTFTCEVSGERPRFVFEKKDYVVPMIVQPSDAEITVSIQREQSPVRVTLNCTSVALPSPNLVWSIDDQKVPADFSGKVWNSTTKLMHAWSSFSTTPESGSPLNVKCTPEVSKNNQIVRGHAAEYTWNHAGDLGSGIYSTKTFLIINILISLKLLR